MKKRILFFAIFLLVYGGALGLIYYRANPDTSLSREIDCPEWNGHIENESGTYDGALIGNLYSGTGRFSFLSGEIYVGDWQDSEMMGSGKMTFPEIGEYSGEMQGSVREGQGEFTWYTGEKYEGNWKEDKMSGNGKYTFSSGNVLEGVFENNKPISGSIDYISQNDNSNIKQFTYRFDSNERKIDFTTIEGLSYKGDISGLFESGSAEIKYPSGNTYSGTLNNGKRNETGVYSWKDSSGRTTSYYDGKWKDDHMNGFGSYHYSGAEYPYLSGTFVNDVPTGLLTYYKEAGNTFDTRWENGACIEIKET